MTFHEGEPSVGRDRRLVNRYVVGAFAALAVAVLVGWAGATVLRPAEDPLAASSFTFVEVQTGEVSSSIRSHVSAEWVLSPIGVNQAIGIVTATEVGVGEEVKQGSVLYRVGERPVVIAQGLVPMYRDLSEGMFGTDVEQLQAMLIAEGVRAGSIDGMFGSHTAAEVREWQKSLGVASSGAVGVGDVIFVPELPARVTLDAAIVERGASLVGGEKAVQGLALSPRLVIPATVEQASRIPLGTPVEISSPEGRTWMAVVSDQVTDPQTQQVIVNLSSTDDEAICRQECAQIPVVGQSYLSAEIVVMPAVSGLVVPSAALVTDASGESAVIDATGVRIPVVVVASARGMSVVKGVDDGVKVRVPASGESEKS